MHCGLLNSLEIEIPCLKTMWKWCLGTWIRGEGDSAVLTVGIELGGLFQPEGFCEMVPGALEGLYWDFLCAPG